MTLTMTLRSEEVYILTLFKTSLSGRQLGIHMELTHDHDILDSQFYPDGKETDVPS